jgi:hypothetical protein
MAKCQFNWGLFLSIVSALIIGAGGVVMLAYYHHDDVHCNAYGYITNTSSCYETCGPVTQYCTGHGTLGVTYQFDSDFNTTEWHQGTIKVPLFCALDCCDAYMAGRVVVYFEVEDDGTIDHTGVVHDYNLETLLTFGIIALILAGTCGGIAIFIRCASNAYRVT